MIIRLICQQCYEKHKRPVAMFSTQNIAVKGYPAHQTLLKMIRLSSGSLD